MKETSRLATWGARLGLLALAVLIIAIASNHLGILGYKLPLYGIAAAALLGVLAILVSFGGLLMGLRRRAGAGAAVAGFILGILAAGPLASTLVLGKGVPRIHDITTDLANPPQFDMVVGLREGAPNALDRATPPDLAEQQMKAYPDLATLDVAQQPGKVFEIARVTAKEMGWTIDSSEPEKGLIEATVTTKLIGFKDDVAIRVTEKGEGAAVDLRSVSRVGVSDLGANANRIRAYLIALKKNLAAPAAY